MYLLFAIALIVGLVPTTVLAAHSVGSAVLSNTSTTMAYNVLGGNETFSLPNGMLGHDWTLSGDGVITFNRWGGQDGDNSVTISANTVGAVVVTVVGADGNTYRGEKKWGLITTTSLTASGNTGLLWSEFNKSWYGYGNVTETVNAQFAGLTSTQLADGAVIYWYLFDASVPSVGPVSHLPINRLGQGGALKADLDQLIANGYGAKHVTFTSGGSPLFGTTTKTTSGDFDAGQSKVGFTADGPEAVRIIAVATYPNDPPQYQVRPEFTSWNFWATEMEQVPQVKWMGEKIVLEKYWGTEFNLDGEYDYVVHYELQNGSNGTLEAVEDPLLNLTNDATSVWTEINEDGVSQVILTSAKPGECDVTCSLYIVVYDENEHIEGLYLFNQHGFVVYFLKMESMTLSIVNGDRTGHNSGLWTPGNPFIADALGGRGTTECWNIGDDKLFDTENVSADSLLRVRVNGFFLGDDVSIRAASFCDVNASGGDADMGDYILPAGRWVLPDDWEYLAGSQWDEFRPNWDIMNDPSTGFVLGTSPVGPYYLSTTAWVKGATQIAGGTKDLATGDDPPDMATWLVVGPYSSLDDGVVMGRTLPYCSVDFNWGDWASKTYRDTIVPDNVLNWTDCPMPAAKITFEIQSGEGFFKAVDKADVYYYQYDVNHNGKIDTSGETFYTDPFYATEVAASPEIPPVINNGGYDWDSWGWTLPDDMVNGPYYFWQFINVMQSGEVAGDATHPTKVQVYSDNHGEAMAYLNGDSNLQLTDTFQLYYNAVTKTLDIPYGTEMGKTLVVAYADYPYLRKAPAISSWTVEETWEWGKSVVVLVEQMKVGSSDTEPNFQQKRVWVLVSDRDEFPVVGERIVWEVLYGTGTIQYYANASGTAVFVVGGTLTATTTTYLLTDATQAATLSALFGGIDISKYGVSYVIVNSVIPGTVALKVLADETIRAWGENGEGWIERYAVSAGASGQYLEFLGTINDPVDPEVNLTAGWNLVSFASGNQGIAGALQSIAAKVVSVWAFDNASKSWEAYSPTAPAWANNLTMMETATPYWIEVSTDVVWKY